MFTLFGNLYSLIRQLVKFSLTLVFILLGMDRKKLLIVTNVDWFLISHRLILAKAAVAAGWKVYVACEDTGRGGEISIDGIEFINFPLSRSGTNPIDEFRLYRRFKELYLKIKPDVVHQITIKPVVYGSIAAKKAGVRGVVNAISGMGYMFTEGKIGFLQKIILKLIRIGGNRNNVAFIFQNNDDKSVLERFGVLKNCKSINLIKGSGINLQHFAFKPLPNKDDKIRILFPSRMLWDKGVRELREASDILKEKYLENIQFILVGMADDNNKSAVSKDYLNEWQDGHYVMWKGHVDDMKSEYENAHIVILPSYREGLPKTLIEACAIGRAIVTTEAVGCKDCVDEADNGLKVPVKDGRALAIAIEKLLHNKSLIVEMGKKGREKAEREFNVIDVVNKHLEIYNSFFK